MSVLASSLRSSGDTKAVAFVFTVIVIDCLVAGYGLLSA
jgi:hypothetical protein